MRRLFRDEYGSAVSLPVNAIAYELTNGGDTVRGKPEEFPALLAHVWREVQSFDDLYLSEMQVQKAMETWLCVNEAKSL